MLNGEMAYDPFRAVGVTSLSLQLGALDVR